MRIELKSLCIKKAIYSFKRMYTFINEFIYYIFSINLFAKEHLPLSIVENKLLSLNIRQSKFFQIYLLEKLYF